MGTIKVGIIGAGFVGESFGKALIKVGYNVMFSSRDPQGEHAQRVRAETGAAVGLPGEVLAFSSLIAIAMPPDTVLQFAKDHAEQLRGKVIIDMNNRLAPGASGQSFAQDLAAASGGRVVKAFNTIGAEHYLNPDFDGEAATMFIAGDDADAKVMVTQLAVDLHFDVVDVGDLDAARHVENLAGLWIHLMRSGHGRNFAFKLINRA